MKSRLNSVSPCLCLAKWLHVTLHLPTGRSHSCYHPKPHKIPLNEISKDPSALHNTTFKIEQREKMLKGNRPEECSYCWGVEDLPGEHLSDRHYRSAEEWAEDRFDEVIKLGKAPKINPSYVEVNFNNACQFKCSYCSPLNSSSWMQEIKQLGPYPTSWGHNRIDWMEKNDLIPIPESDPNPYVDAFWKWWPSLYKDLRFFRMTGGEPLIDVNTYRVLDYVAKNPHKDLSLSITSNLCPPEKSFIKFLNAAQNLEKQQCVKRFFLFVSLDGVGARAEYIRYGMKFDLLRNNIHTLLNEVPSMDFSFIFTFSNLSLGGLREFLNFVLELRKQFPSERKRISFDLPMLNSPEFLSLRILPPHLVQVLENDLEFMRLHFSEEEVDKLARLIDWMKAGWQSMEKRRLMADFFLYFNEYDKRRNLNFKKTFPELENFFQACKEEAILWTKERLQRWT